MTSLLRLYFASPIWDFTNSVKPIPTEAHSCFPMKSPTLSVIAYNKENSNAHSKHTTQLR